MPSFTSDLALAYGGAWLMELINFGADSENKRYRGEGIMPINMCSLLITPR
jgi:hypothetical protein